MTYHPKHPQAKLAMWLAHYLDGAHPDQITHALIVSECPRRLFVLAATLRKAKRNASCAAMS